MRPAFEALRESKDARSSPIVAEVGVAKGDNAQEVLDNYPGIFLYLVDNYSEAPERLAAAKLRLLNYTAAWRLGDSVEVAQMFPDGHFDMVYLDGDHTYEGVKADIVAWLPKIRRGGIIGGHDYDNTSVPGVGRAVREFYTEQGFQLHIRPGQATADWWVYV